MQTPLAQIVDLAKYPLDDARFRAASKQALDEHGVFTMPDFLLPAAIESICREGQENKHLAFYTQSNHNIYLSPADPQFAADHPRNREVVSSKGCITTDQIPTGSALMMLYEASEFREFLCDVLSEAALYEYADPLSSVNLHFADEGQELGWHFDNSSFAITLLIQKPQAGSVFEYVKNVRDADAGEMNYDEVGKILDGEAKVNNLSMDAGALVLFRGRNSIHRVTPVKGERTRILAVLAYNSQPGVSLSESARLTFYGRV